jgi:hypothetical protein
MTPSRRWIIGLAITIAPLAALAFAQQPGGDAAARLFREEVVPILQRSCLSCHNPSKARGGLDLSTHAALLEGGDNGAVLVAGNAKSSRLYQMIAGPAPKMPRQADPLMPDEVAVIGRWIDAGATWPKGMTLTKAKPADAPQSWWSLTPLKRPPLPAVKNPAWCKTPIDYFVAALHEAKGLRAAAPADRSTLLRRLKYDLHGLPPTLAEIAEFQRDCDAETPAGAPATFIPDAALERLVDRLLAAPHYGERWGRHWLDVVHYADTHGYDKDKRRLWAWLYRDWVIRAFNRDLPFRRFIHYQLAGDVLFPDDPDGVIATGFVVAGPWDFVGHVELREGTVDKEKTRALDRDDMVSNAIATFNSMTIHCARCHEHKFDPIPMKDYYALQAVFAGVERGDRDVVTPELRSQQLALEQQLGAATKRQAELERRIAEASSPELHKLDEQRADLRRQLAALPKPAATAPSRTNGYHSAIEKRADVVKWVQVDLGRSLPIDTVRLVPARPVDFPDTPGFGFPVRFQVAVSAEPDFKNAELLINHTAADYPNPGDNAVSLPAGGKPMRYIRVTAHKLWLRSNDFALALAELQAFSGDKNVAPGAKVTALDSIEAGLWSTRHLVDGHDSRQKLPDPSDAIARQRLDIEMRLAQLDQERLALADKLVEPSLRQAVTVAAKRSVDLQRRLTDLKASMKVYAVLPVAPRPIHVLARGDVERKGKLAAPGALSTIFPHLDRHFADFQPGHGVLSTEYSVLSTSTAGKRTTTPAAEGLRRAALARWLSDDQNHLTWRSIVNRVWHYHFGKGLVDTPNDFGKNGSLPSHPELLDWLACEFRDGGDSFKRLHKMIVLSATYRQASTHHVEFAKIDGDNRFLWRMNRQRLDAESIRDSVLAVAGTLKPAMHGPGYDLFRFKDDHSPVYDHLDVTKSTHPDTWRRTVYRFVVRSVPNPFLETLDCADPNINVPARNTTLTALQALALLNNPFMVQQAEHFAERLRALEPTPERQIDAAYRLALGRQASPEERTALAGYARRHGLANACRLLFNANEFMFVD